MTDSKVELKLERISPYVLKSSPGLRLGTSVSQYRDTKETSKSIWQDEENYNKVSYSEENTVLLSGLHVFGCLGKT